MHVPNFIPSNQPDLRRARVRNELLLYEKILDVSTSSYAGLFSDVSGVSIPQNRKEL